MCRVKTDSINGQNWRIRRHWKGESYKGPVDHRHPWRGSRWTPRTEVRHSATAPQTPATGQHGCFSFAPIANWSSASSSITKSWVIFFSSHSLGRLVFYVSSFLSNIISHCFPSNCCSGDMRCRSCCYSSTLLCHWVYMAKRTD